MRRALQAYIKIYNMFYFCSHFLGRSQYRKRDNSQLRWMVGNEAQAIGEHEHMELVQVKKYGEEYCFILRDMSTSELQELKNRSDIDYIAMMTGS